MNHMLVETYLAFYSERSLAFKERIDLLRKTAYVEMDRYLKDIVPLFVNDEKNSRLRQVFISTIEADIKEAACSGVHFVSYRVHKHLYPGYKGDNISFLTGKYYIWRAETRDYLEVPGAPSYLQALRARLPGLLITFIEESHNNGVVRVEIPI